MLLVGVLSLVDISLLADTNITNWIRIIWLFLPHSYYIVLETAGEISHLLLARIFDQFKRIQSLVCPFLIILAQVKIC
jgi:hypothetical protein